jgi:hypothetical protein
MVFPAVRIFKITVDITISGASQGKIKMRRTYRSHTDLDQPAYRTTALPVMAILYYIQTNVNRLHSVYDYIRHPYTTTAAASNGRLFQVVAPHCVARDTRVFKFRYSPHHLIYCGISLLTSCIVYIL